MFSALLYLLIFAKIDLSIGQNSNGNKLWILLDDMSMFSCRGVTNRLQINEKDVTIRNQQGHQVHYLEAPGTYVLSFHNIRVDQPMPNLSGQISGVLQVPVVAVGSVLNWDFPYSLIPEKQVFGYRCDKLSGPVTDGGKQYCRYCDLCTTSEQVDQVVNTKEHKYLPNVGSPSEQQFDRICTQIDPKLYTMQRTISLPDRQELEKQANAQYSGLGGELKKKLNKGKGKLQMEMQIMSSDQKQIDRDSVYSQSPSCRCCLPGNQDVSCKINFLGTACNQDTCSSEYAQKCIRPNAQKVACYTTQFNYQVTDKPEDVKAFLAKNNYKDEYNDLDGNSHANSGAKPNSNSAGGNSNANSVRSPGSGQKGNQHSSHGNGDQNGNGNNNNANGGQEASAAQQRQCIQSIKEDRFKRLCELRWQQNFCCRMCEAC